MNKYRNKPAEIDGIRFASMAESRRYGELKLLERAGEISDLKLQPRYRLQVNGFKIADYVADFSYLDKKNKFAIVVEDVKGVRTPVYLLKKKLLKACHGLDVVEITKGR